MEAQPGLSRRRFCHVPALIFNHQESRVKYLMMRIYSPFKQAPRKALGGGGSSGAASRAIASAAGGGALTGQVIGYFFILY